MKKRIILLALAFIISSSTMLIGINPVFASEYASKFDFEDFDLEDDAIDIEEILDEWVVEYGQATNSAKVLATEGNSNKYLTLDGYVAISSQILLETPYTFSFDVQLNGTNISNIAFFVRGMMPVIKLNPAFGSGGNMNFRYFETDWYKENKGTNGESGLGVNGISVVPQSGGLRVNIKTYEPDGLKIGNKFVSFPYPEGVDITKFFNVKFVDSGNKVDIYINSKLIATVEMSEKGIYEDDPEDENEYLKKAIIKDATGKEVLNISNARICPAPSQVAIGNRNRKFNIDNLTLTYNAPDPTTAPDQTQTPNPTQNQQATQRPSVTANPNTEKPGSSSAVTDNSGFTTTIIVIVVAVLVVTAGAVSIIIMGKKNKKV